MTPYQHNNGNRRTLSLPNKPQSPQNASNCVRKDKEQSRPLPEFHLAPLTKELFDTIADECAKTISETVKKEVNRATQIRRFYDELVMWNDRADSDEKFTEVLPFVYMIKSKVAYAKGRATVDSTFQEFINETIGQIDNRETLNNAKLFMEAVMGFYKQYKKD